MKTMLHGMIAALAAILASLALAQAPAARTIAIAAPAHEETVHSNLGEVSVRVEVTPPLQRGETIVIALDGREVARGGKVQVQLEGVERGEHRLQAKLLDAQGRTLAQSAPVTFHMWQASKLFPSRKKAQP